jgi:hypothetical protein
MSTPTIIKFDEDDQVVCPICHSPIVDVDEGLARGGIQYRHHLTHVISLIHYAASTNQATRHDQLQHRNPLSPPRERIAC